MNRRFCLLSCGLVMWLPTWSAAQSDERPVETINQRWRFGIEVTAGDAPATGLVMSTPIPMSWPEQQVKLVDKEISDNVKRVTYKILSGGVRQMLATVPRLGANQSARAVMTYEITKQYVPVPVDADSLLVPKSLSRDVRRFLAPSPYIESTDPRIQSLAAEIVTREEPAWQQVVSIYEWVRENIRYEFSPTIKSGVQALEDRVGDCEELTSVFVACCRANRIPARSVWVPNHCYPEFYLVDSKGVGRWIPCQAAGARDFGRMPEPRPILQKGDSFRVQGHRQALRYVRPTLTVRNTTAAPTLKWIVEPVTD